MTTSTARTLVVVADDLGLGPGIDTGILEAHHHGVVTAASMLTIGPSFEHAASLAREAPRLDVGIHLALVGPDAPASDPADVPSLVDRRGRFAGSWRSLLPRLVAGRLDVDEVRAEWVAQIRRLRCTGIEPAHLDTHQHVHLWPSLTTVAIDLARAEGIPVVRVPRSGGPGTGRVLDRLGRRVAEQLDRAGIGHADAFAGWRRAGHHTTDDVIAAIDRLDASGARTAELSLHPGRPDETTRERYPWGFSWDDELTAALAGRVRAHIDDGPFRLGGTSELLRDGGPVGPGGVGPGLPRDSTRRPVTDTPRGRAASGRWRGRRR